jgi:hypothetical protein
MIELRTIGSPNMRDVIYIYIAFSINTLNKISLHGSKPFAEHHLVTSPPSAVVGLLNGIPHKLARRVQRSLGEDVVQG